MVKAGDRVFVLVKRPALNGVERELTWFGPHDPDEATSYGKLEGCEARTISLNAAWAAAEPPFPEGEALRKALEHVAHTVSNHGGKLEILADLIRGQRGKVSDLFSLEDAEDLAEIVTALEEWKDAGEVALNALRRTT